MKLRPMILLCSLGLLAAQAGAEGLAATNAQAVANQSEATTQTIKTESATQADAPKESIVKGKMRETKMAALGNMRETNKYQDGTSLAINKTRPGVVTRNGAQFVARANDGVNQTNATFVVCHPCQPGDKSGSCCAVGCD